MGPDFRGETADFYAQFRRGYTPPVIDSLVDAFALSAADLVVDLGCGTGQLTLPLAGRVRAVVGMDPEPDMLARAHHEAGKLGVTNATWLLGADSDISSLASLLGDGRLGAVTIGQALHWMHPETLFPAVAPLLRDNGGIAVVTNGIPLWLQDTAWSRALRAFLEEWLGTRLENPCGTDDASHRRYRDLLTAAGFAVHTRTVEYTDVIDVDYLIGNVYSALSPRQLPGTDQRSRFAERLRGVLQPHQPFVERVRVTVLIGRQNRSRA